MKKNSPPTIADLRQKVDADVLVMDAAYVVEGRPLPNGKPLGARSVEYPAWVSFVQLCGRRGRPRRQP